MEQPIENNAVQGDISAPADPISLGVSLREARERLGLSVADVANQTKLAPRQIEALEAEDFRHLPEMPFVRGFVRSYAKILHLDALPLLAVLPPINTPEVPLAPASVEAPFPSAHSPQRQNLVWLGMALLLAVLVVALAVWHFTAPPARTDAVQAETSNSARTLPAPPVIGASIVQPAESAPRPSEERIQTSTDKPLIPQAKPKTQPADQPVAPSPAMLRMTFDEDSWVEIKEKEDKVLSSQVNSRGSELRINGQPPFSLVIGHAASVRLYYRGKQVDLAPHINTVNEVARLTLE